MTDAQLDALFARARTTRPDTSRAEYAFETRVAAQIREKREADASSIWAKVSWRMLPIFATGVLGLAILQSHLAHADDVDTIGNALDNPEGIVLSGMN
jgi:hypothetical protein